MRVAALQLDYTIGDLPGNAQAIVAGYRRACAAGADLVFTSELALCGYPPRDLLNRPSFLAACDDRLAQLARAVGSVPLVIGAPTCGARAEGQERHNSLVVLAAGAEIGRYHKQLLPTYDVFDERRYFEPGPAAAPLLVAGLPLGLTICEDFWNDKDFWTNTRYHNDPLEQLVAGGARLLVNLSASPYARGKLQLREEMLAAACRKWGLPVVYVNQVGGNDGLIFDGSSLILDRHGAVVARGQAFDQDLLVVDLEVPERASPRQRVGQPASPAWRAQDTSALPDPPGWEEECADALCLGIRDYCAKCGFARSVVGLSGGVDSALVAALASRALGPGQVTGVTMPSRYSPQDSPGDAAALAANLGIALHALPIEPLFAPCLELLAPIFGPPPWGVTQENLQARLRGLLLMAFSNRTGALLLTTGNKSEMAVGYATLYGDMAGGLAVIADLYKTDVYRLAAWLNDEAGRELIPRSSMTKPPSAELAPGQKDQDSLPPYEELDAILRGYLEGEHGGEEIIARGADPDTVRRVIAMVHKTEYKRQQAAPVLKVTGLAFGVGRRYPIAQKFWA